VPKSAREITRLMQRERLTPYGVLSPDGPDGPTGLDGLDGLTGPDGLVVAFLSSSGVVRLGDTEARPDDVGAWLETTEVDVVVSLNAEPKCATCVGVRLLSVLADGKCTSLEQLALETLGTDASTDELTFLARATSELGVVEHLMELANVTGVQMRELVARGVLHRSFEQVLRAAKRRGLRGPRPAAARARAPRGRPRPRSRRRRPPRRRLGPRLPEHVPFTHRGAPHVLHPDGATCSPPLMRAMHAEREALRRELSTSVGPVAAAARREAARREARDERHWKRPFPPF
jgi:hypothetical protein